jgi:hypothetical protein
VRQDTQLPVRPWGKPLGARRARGIKSRLLLFICGSRCGRVLSSQVLRPVSSNGQVRSVIILQYLLRRFNVNLSYIGTLRFLLCGAGGQGGILRFRLEELDSVREVHGGGSTAFEIVKAGIDEPEGLVLRFGTYAYLANSLTTMLSLLPSFLWNNSTASASAATIAMAGAPG